MRRPTMAERDAQYRRLLGLDPDGRGRLPAVIGPHAAISSLGSGPRQDPRPVRTDAYRWASWVARTDEQQWHAACQCGWKGDEVSSAKEAQAPRAAHAATHPAYAPRPRPGAAVPTAGGDMSP